MHQHGMDVWCSSIHLRKCRMTMDVEIKYRYIARVNMLVSEHKCHKNVPGEYYDFRKKTIH